MKKVFTSGSCRLLCLFDDSLIQYKTIESIHSVNFGFKGGVNFCGKLHTAKQHLYFLKYLLWEQEINEEDKKKIFSMLTDFSKTYLEIDPYYNFDCAIDNIRKEIFKTKIFVFEICSIKNYTNKNNGIPRQMELIDTKSEDDDYDNEYYYYDILNLVNFVNEKFGYPLIILIGHLRNWVFDNTAPYLDERDKILDSLKKIEELNKNVKIIDPSIIIKKEDLDDPWHYGLSGYNKMHNTLNEIIEEYIEKNYC